MKKPAATSCQPKKIRRLARSGLIKECYLDCGDGGNAITRPSGRVATGLRVVDLHLQRLRDVVVDLSP